MPRFSIIIPVYNTAQYLDACLAGVRDQTYPDWEAVVVIDASPDGSAEIANRFAAADARFRVVEKPVNEGLHLARKTGMQYATGDYILFLDSDDEFAPFLLQKLAEQIDADPEDIIRFGSTVIDAGVAPEAARSYEDNANREFPPLTGREMIRLAYEEAGGFRLSWRAWASAFSARVAKAGFDAMTSNRLERAEDAYEFLVLASLTEHQIARMDIKGYRYYFGRGVTGDSTIAPETYLHHVQCFQNCMDAIDDYAARFEAFDLGQAAAGAHVKLCELMFNDWQTRLADADKTAVAEAMAPIIGTDAVASELMRLSRDALYDSFARELPLAPDAPCLDWYRKAEELASCQPASLRYRRFASSAASHLKDLARVLDPNVCDSQRIRIFVATHKPSKRFDSAILQPIQVGSSNARNRFHDMLHDDSGDNISELNPYYCELTAQYWAWKNVDADYYGFCHYRRYFNFAENRFGENGWGEIMEPELDAAAQEKYGLTDECIGQFVRQYDVITTESKDIRKFPSPAKTAFEHWHEAASLYDKDLTAIFSILLDAHPDYAEDVESYINGNFSRFCNMFIMRKDIFSDYCAWLFPLLERFMAETDMSGYSHESQRTPGHLSERLLNVYLNHHIRMGADWRIKEVQCVHFEKTDPLWTPSIPSAEAAQGLPIIPVVLAADNNYVPMLTTTLCSMLQNASPGFHYHILVLTSDITGANQQIMRDYLCGIRSATLEFYNVRPLLGDYRLSTNNAHISVETYYRFLIQDILPFYDKVLYLDSDLIIEGDVSELYATELGDDYIAAVTDADFLGNLNMADGERLDYAHSILGMENPYGYFQAGVLVLNTAALRREIPVATWLEAAQNPKYIYNDQDILNEYCEGRVVYLDFAWNVMIDGCERIARVISHAPADVYDAFLKSRANEKVIHYAGAEKPWNNARCDRGTVYWRYARTMPFYEELVARLAISAQENPVWQGEEWALAEDSPLRRLVNPLLPVGSRRRQIVRDAALKIRHLRD